jgi:hypothetical protein
MTVSGFTCRTRRFLLWTARLALVVYLAQLIAIDHWQAHPVDIVGLEGSSAHVAHCHGAGDCSDGGGAVTSPALGERSLLPLPSRTLTISAEESETLATAVYREMPLRPPIAA